MFQDGPVHEAGGLQAGGNLRSPRSWGPQSPSHLLQSVGNDTNAAAEKANVAITDMSDNANKMGTDMGLIQNAYQGFAKANYTMLDNLDFGGIAA